MDKAPDNIVSLEQAKILVSGGYKEQTDWFWDRYNPTPDKVALAWRLSERRGRKLDNTCCLPAPTIEEYEEWIKH